MKRLTLFLCLAASLAWADDIDLILHRGKVCTVDKAFSVAEAVAVKDGRIVRVGTSADVLKLRGERTRVVDLEGRFVMPGLIDSHVHPAMASMHEFDHTVPEMETVGDVLRYIRSRTEAVPAGGWIVVNQVFITRLREQRYPTKAELDEVAPQHPVLFSTGPDGVANSLAMKLSGIDRNFVVTGAGQIEKDPQTGEPTGMFRGGTKRYLKTQPSGKSATEQDRIERMALLFRDYNSVGLTTIGERDGSTGEVERMAALRAARRLTVRCRVSLGTDPNGRIEAVQDRIREVAKHPRRQPDPLVQIIGIKMYLDGGMLTGSAYMREPWGVSRIYSITDPEYRGVLFIPKDRLLPIVRTTVEAGLQFTAHSVGDGAVHTLLETYEEIDRDRPVRPTRPCITHCNFMSREAVERMARIGVVCDIQPAWLWLDTRTLTAQFGYDRLRYFQPLKSAFEQGLIAGGGSDHMQKVGSLRSVNPYDPFLGLWVTQSRRARWYDGQLHPEEALTREQALRFYTINNAYVLALDDQVGSLEPGKLADLIVLDRDLLTCPLDEVRGTRVIATYLGGKQVWPAE